MEEAQRKVHNAINNLVEDVDKSSLRNMQGDMHRCAARCCDNSNATLEQTHQCINSCSDDISKANNFIQTQLGNFQRRLERCTLDCQDSIRDKVLPNAKPEDMDKFKGQFEGCVLKCVDNNVHKLPGLADKLKTALASRNYYGEYI